MNILERLRDKANSLPESAGVYIMKDKHGKVIYFGKSRKLKNRVSQYFQNSRKNIKTERMVRLAEDFEYIVCSTEIEALTLENTLIKQYAPKYNIRLNNQQERALLAVEGSNLLLAVPGSGKTTGLVERLGHMVINKNIQPQSILAITYNTAAAEEMESRFSSQFGDNRHIVFKFFIYHTCIFFREIAKVYRTRCIFIEFRN